MNANRTPPKKKKKDGKPFAAAPESPEAAAFFPRPLVAAILISQLALKQRNRENQIG